MQIKELFKYRIYWIGFAILWVMLYHCSASFTGVCKWIACFGYGGVDIFFFASGIGNYYSYHKDQSPLHFIKRKMQRLAPTYIPFILIWLFIKISNGSVFPNAIIGNLFGIQGFISNGGEFNWFLTGIILCYILTPYFASYIKENNMKKNITIILFLILVSIAFWGDTKMIISITRLPIFVIGMMVAKYGEMKYTKKINIILFLTFILGIILLATFYLEYNEYLWGKGLYWYPFIIITPFLCMFLSSVIKIIIERKTLYKIFKIPIIIIEEIGNCSFEIFLIHILILGEVWNYVSNFPNISLVLVNLLACFISIIISIIYKHISNHLYQIIRKYRH